MRFWNSSVSILLSIGLVACATSETKVLEPYQLADGSRYQDVVTIGADSKGSAPVVTDVKTFRLKQGKAGPSGLVSQATGTGAGMTTVVTGAVAAGAVSGITAGAISYAARSRTNVNVNGSKGQNQSYDDVACAAIPEAIRMTIQRCLCEISSFNPGCENNPNPTPGG